MNQRRCFSPHHSVNEIRAGTWTDTLGIRSGAWTYTGRRELLWLVDLTRSMG